MYAIIQTGGKQYRVRPGDVVQVELLGRDSGSVEFTDVFLVGNAEQVLVGQPVVPDARVRGTVVGTDRYPKVLVFKKKRRKHYKRTIGHRQYFTAVRIDAIEAAGMVSEAEPAAKAAKKPAPAPRAATRRKPAKAGAAKRVVRKKVAARPKAGRPKRGAGGKVGRDKGADRRGGRRKGGAAGSHK